MPLSTCHRLVFRLLLFPLLSPVEEDILEILITRFCFMSFLYCSRAFGCQTSFFFFNWVVSTTFSPDKWRALNGTLIVYLIYSFLL